jgi:protein O-GlcNAc transferase
MLELSVEQTLAVAMQHHQAGRWAEAQQLYEQVLARDPENPNALHLQGVLAFQKGENDRAAALLEKALARRPAAPVYLVNLGLVRQAQGQLDAAITAFREAARLAPDLPEAHFNLGNVLQARGQMDAAITAYREALRLRPADFAVHSNLGAALAGAGQVEAAVASYREALRLNPSLGQVHFNLGNAQERLKRLDEAAAAYREAVRLKPDLAEAYYNLGRVLKDQGQVAQAMAAYREAMRLRPESSLFHSSLLFVMNYLPEGDAQMIATEAAVWNQRHGARWAGHIRRHDNVPEPTRRLRVGYVSPDLFFHSLSYYLLPLLAHHDHAQFEIFGYADVAAPDEVTQRIRGRCDQWRDIVHLSDEQVAEMIRQDRIDILVDLTMHMSVSRLPIFARKPAPVQVSWLAYPGTTGLATIDYRVSDAYLDPPGMDESCYSEKTIRLPGCYWCYQPLVDRVEVSALPCTAQGYVTFGCLNGYYKVNDAVLRLWAQVLQAVEGSRLLLLAYRGSHREQALKVLGEGGIAAQRVEFVEPQPCAAYMRLYHQVDISLDPFPYNGHTSSFDSLWMGVPVVTLLGKTVVGRGGYSQLMNLGLPELVAREPVEYVRIAAELAGDRARLAKLRSSLRPRMQASRLMDGPRFARDMEAALRDMWRRWCAGAGGPDSGKGNQSPVLRQEGDAHQVRHI